MMPVTDPVMIENWRELELHEYCEAFPSIPDNEMEELRQSIVGSGLRMPIVLFEGKILDGRHRHKICMDTNVEPHFEEFMGPGSAASYVIDTNLRRRNLTPEQKRDVLEKLAIALRDRARKAQIEGGKTGGGKLSANLQKAEGNVVPIHVDKEIAKLIGVSERTAADMSAIKKQGTLEDWQEVLEGKSSVSGKADEVRKRKRVQASKPKQSEYITLTAWNELSLKEREIALAVQGKKKLNEQDNESIGWAKWSWNPITGCLHNCPYCYARDIANRFYEQGFEPSIVPERLTAPQNQQPRDSNDVADRNIFTGSMADMFGKWVPEKWIDAVMASVEQSPDWNFLFLTKFPRRMINREVPNNVWLGTSVDTQARIKAVESAFAEVPAHTRWLSIEPLLEPLEFTRPELFQWVVIGGASESTKTPKWSPPFSWVAKLYTQFKEAGAAVYIKNNIGFDGFRRPREYPWQRQQGEHAPKEFSYRGNQ